MGKTIPKKTFAGAKSSRGVVSSPAQSARGAATVLVAVTGMSPAILTETVWALARETPPVRPGKIVVFGTSQSRVHLQRALLDSGVWENLRKSLHAGPDELVFGNTSDHIRVFSFRGRELDDIRTPQDNSATADFMLEHLRAFTDNPDQRIIGSIAGGRKTMGALLYAAMTLIGRETDRLTHVLVDPALETRRDPPFYFPANAAEARAITLADVPFVPLRNKFVELGRMPGGFGTLVRHYTRRLAEDSVTLVQMDDTGLTATVNGITVELSKRAYIVLKFAIHLRETDSVPKGLDIADDTLKAFISKTGLHPQWAETAYVDPDLRRELNHIRRAFDRQGIEWKPGMRRDALRLPPFRRV